MPTVFEAKKGSSVRTAAAKIRHNAAGYKAGLLTSFCRNPDGIRFETQADEETVILFLRQHLIFLLLPGLFGIFLLLAPTFLLPLMVFLTGRLPISLPPGYFLVGTVFWYVATAGFLLSTFLHWFFNIYIVTNERIVDIDFVNLLYKEFSEAELSKIQDLTFTAKGVFAAIFNYGDVLIQTAGELPNIEFLKVPQPDDVVKVISELVKQQKDGDV